MKKEKTSAFSLGLKTKKSRAKERRDLEQLAQMALKYKIDPNKFSDCILKAWNLEKSEFKELSVKCRQRNEETSVFLFAVGGKIAAQFPISTKTLLGNEKLGENMKRLTDDIKRIKASRRNRGRPTSLKHALFNSLLAHDDHE